MVLYEKQRTPGFWRGVRENAVYRETVERMETEYRALSEAGIKPLTKAEYDAYFETGDRATFEKNFFARRALLERAFLLAMLYPEKETYLQTVREMILTICEETCWVVPAHFHDHKVDLFSSETALILTECVSFLGERLERQVRDTALREAERRVIAVYEAEKEFVWEKYTSNWSAVCTASVAITMMYAFPQAFERNKTRVLKAQELFLSGFSDDGICFEGPLYWIYGFGNFVWLADALFDFSGGRDDLFRLPKAKTVAAYPNYAVLKGGAFVSFSDSSRNAIFERPLLNCIQKHDPSITFSLNGTDLIFARSSANMQPFLLRNFFFGDSLPVTETAGKDHELPSAGQMIFNRETYSFAIKAGNNAELHNHNDVGSFIFADAEGQALCDLGCGMYNRDYFSEKRYEILCTSSYGHSVPIINGSPQKPGKQYAGTLSRDHDTVTLDLKNAYDLPTLESLTRTVTAKREGVTVHDRFCGDIQSFVDRFVTLREPQISENTVKLGGTVIRFDSQKAALTVSTAVHRNGRGEKETVYLLGFKAKDNIDHLCFEIETA